jgi:hypothetical protein
MQTDVIRRISIQATQQGVPELTSGLKGLGDAQNNIVAISDKQQRAHLSVAAALEKQQRSLDITYRSTQQFEKAQRDLDQAQQQGLLTAQRYAELSGLNAARMNEQTRAANDNTKAANDNAEGWRLSGVEMASVTNHVKQAAAAAYVLSPAFRALVNPAIAVGVQATGTALAAIGPTAAGVATSIGARMLPALAFVARFALPILLVVDAFRAMAAITELGAQKLKEFNELAANAGKAGVSTDFFQNAAKGAEELGLKTDSATASLKKFNEVTTEKLGGSDFEQRLDVLVKAGNFVNNSGVAAYKAATDAESRYRAVVDLITQAMDAGQRLAALDLAAKFLPPDLLDKLRANGQVLKEMQVTADATKPVTIVSPEQIGYAIELKRRLTEANETIEKGLKPLQKDLTQLGLNYQESWVAIVEVMASAVTGLNTMYGWVKSIKDVFEDIGKLSFWTKLTQLTGAMGLNSTPESMGLIMPGQPGFSGNTGSGSAANSQLAGALYNPTAIFQAMLKANNTQYRAQKDTSFDPDKKKEIDDVNDAVDRAINTLRRHVEQQKADTLAVGLGDGALARFRAEAAETAAVLANGGKETDEQRKLFAKLKDEAFLTADSLARVRVESQGDFANKTKFLSADDVAIAQQLRGIYGNDVPEALASTEAAQIRVTSAQKLLSDGFKDVGRSMTSAFLSGGNAMAAMMQSLDNLAKKLADKAFDNILQGVLSGNLLQAGVGVAQAGASALISAFTGDQKKQEELKKARAEWEKAGPAFSAFLKQMSGGVQGNLSQSIQEAAAREASFEDQAWKARDSAAVNAARSGLQNFSDTQKRLFQATFQATVDALNDGLGLDSPFMKAVNNVKTALNAQLAFIDDTDVAIGENVAGTMAKAKGASQSYLLSLLQQPQALSAVQTGMMQINGTANALQGALVQLGLSSGDAANAINAGVSKAIADLKKQFEGGLTERLNSANGNGFLNDATKLIEQHQKDLQDAAALGSDPALVASVFRAEAQKIVTDAGLIGAAFTSFTTQFPLLAGVVVEATADTAAAAKQLEDAAKAASDRALSLQDRLFAAANDATTLEGQLAAQARTADQQRLAEQLAGNQNSVLLEQTLAAEKLKIIRDSNAKIIADTEAAAKAQQDALNGRAKSIVDFVAGLDAGPNTTSSPLDRLASAKSIYETTLALARANDPGAQARITQDAQNYLDAQRAVSASSEAFQLVLAQIKSQLLALPDVQNTTDPVVQSLRDVLTAINAGNTTQAKDTTLSTLSKDATLGTLLTAAQLQTFGLSKDATLGTLLTKPQMDTLGLSKDSTVTTLLTKTQLDSIGIATSENVGRLLTASQLAEQGLAKNAVVSGLLTEAQITAIGLSKDSTTGRLLTEAQITALGLATNTKLGTLLTPQQLAEAHLAADTTVATLLTQAQLTQIGLAKDVTAAGIGNATAAVFGQVQYSNQQIAPTNSLIGGNAAATAAALTALFNQIDPSGRLSAIYSATANVSDATAAVYGQVQYSNQRIGPTDQILSSTKGAIDGSNTLLDAIKTLQSTATTQLTLLQTALNPSTPGLTTITGYSSPHEGSTTQPYNFTINNQMALALNKIVWNTFATANNTRQLVDNGNDVKGTYASGGLITGPGSGTSDSIRAMLSNREYVMPAARVDQFGVGFFDQLRAGIMPRSIGNDNSRPVSIAAPLPSFRGGNGESNAALLSEMREMNKKIERLEKIIAGSAARGAQATVETGEKIVEATDRQTETLATVGRQQIRAGRQ